MDNNYRIRPKLLILSEEQIEIFYRDAFNVLEEVGVQVLHPEALELLNKAKCQIQENKLVKIGSNLVRQTIESMPKRIEIFDRQGNLSMVLGGKNTGGLNTYYGTGSDLIFTYDLITGELRRTRTEDIANMAKVVDYLPDISFVMSYGLPCDCPTEKIFRTEFMQMVKNTIKPIVFTCDNSNDADRIIKMATIIAGNIEQLRNKPFIICYSQPTSPLRLSFDAIGKVLECSKNNIPVVFPPGIIPGATGPTTMAGTIIQSLAEAFSGLVIHQLKNPGAPIILGGAHGNMDMKSGVNIYASPQRLKTEAILASIYQHFKIPTWGFGGCTDSQVLDEQAGMEFALMVQWASLCGINLAHDTGYMGSGMVGDLKAIVFNNEIISYARNLLCGGVALNDDTKAMDIIEKIGPGGNYLSEIHTVKHFRKEFWQTDMMNRINLSAWKNEGKKRLSEKLGERAKEILNNHKTISIGEEEIKKLEEIINCN